MKRSVKKRSTEPLFDFIDLFAGIGGFRIGLEKSGGRCVFTSEQDRFCQQTYEAWFGDMPSGDIWKIDPLDIPDHHILAAGFPCQAFSLAGVSKKNSLGCAHGFEDEKYGNLFFSITRILETKRPPAFILENVKNLRSHDKGKTWQVIEGELVGLGYNVFHRIVDARHWVPQHRERIFIVGFDSEVFGDMDGFDEDAELWPKPAGKPARLAKVLMNSDELRREERREADAKRSVIDRRMSERAAKLGRAEQRLRKAEENYEKYGESEPDKEARRKARGNLKKMTDEAKNEDKKDKDSRHIGNFRDFYVLSDHLWGYLQKYKKKHEKAGHGFGYGLVNPRKSGQVTRTLSARYNKDGSEILIDRGSGRNPRRLSPREAARLMGFPDKKIVVSNAQAYKQFGNAVVPLVVGAIAKNMVCVMRKYGAIK